MHLFTYILILIAAILLSNLINRFIPYLSAPIVQIVLGVCLALTPLGEMGLEMEPELVFVLFIAPLIFHASMTADKRTLWEMRRPILNIAVLLVVVTTLLIGFLLNAIVPSLPIAAALAMAGALGPTDGVAVAALSKRVAIPRKVMSILEGEFIVNDAAGIVCFQFAVAAMLTGSFSAAKAAGSFLIMALGGILVGAAMTGLKYLLVHWLRGLGMENKTLHLLIDILTPFLVYMAAEATGVSGILAIFASGIIHSFKREKFNPDMVSLNIAHDSIWSLLSFTLDGLVFVMLGTQLPRILRTINSGAYSIKAWGIVGCVLLLTVALAVIRFAWWFLTVRKRTYAEKGSNVGKVKSGIIFSLSGAKGTVTLASVMSMPLLPENGEPFPERGLIILLSAGVIVCSLLIANFVLPIFADKKVGGAKSEDEKTAYVEVLQGVAAHLNSQTTAENSLATEIVIRNYAGRVNALKRGQPAGNPQTDEELQLRLRIMEWERENTKRLIETGVVEEETASRYIDSFDAHIRRLTSGKRAGILRPLKWWLKHLTWRLRRIGRDGTERRRAEHGLRPTAESSFATLIESNSRCVLDKLNALRKESPNPVADRLAAEHEAIIAVSKKRAGARFERPTPFDGWPGAAFSEVAEVYAAGFQAERDLIQQMFENGRISRETAKELRGNIAMLEAQTQSL